MSRTEFDVRAVAADRMTRRAVLAGSTGLVLGGLALAGPLARAQGPAPAAKSVAEDLMKPGSLPDIEFGKADAPVTIVEYASMTCGHCAAFHNTVFPKLKEKYIDTGKARLILREFPLDNLAAAASMLARCAGGEKTPALIKAFFEKQDDWAFVQGNVRAALEKFVAGHGIDKPAVDKCLSDQKLLDGISAIRERANKTFGVRSTPTFFINGVKLEGRSDQIESFDKALEPLLKK